MSETGTLTGWIENIRREIANYVDLGAIFSGQWFDRISAFNSQAHQIFWWPFLISAMFVALAVYLLRSDATLQKRSFMGLLAYCFPVKIFRKRSSFVDLQIFVFTYLFNKYTYNLAFMTAAMLWGMTLASPLADINAGDPVNVTALEAALTAILLVIFTDFTEYWVHRLFHQVPLLWAFHRVHHSADVLNVLTTQRFHPLEPLLEGFLMAVSTGVVFVIATLLFGGVDFWLLFGVNAVYGVVRLGYSHLRHTHVWLNFPKPLCYIFSSPAQHQIHHSRAEHHFDKNFAEIFSFWDFIFGTLYQPKHKERIFFGLAPEMGVHRPRPHRHILDVFLDPILWIGKHYGLITVHKNDHQKLEGRARRDALEVAPPGD